MDPDYYERECNRLNAELAKAWAEIADLRARLDAEASHRLSLGADNDRLLAEIERLRADLVVAVLMNVHIELSNLQSGLDVVFPGSHRTVYDGTPESICRAVREARDGVR